MSYAAPVFSTRQRLERLAVAADLVADVLQSVDPAAWTWVVRSHAIYLQRETDPAVGIETFDSTRQAVGTNPGCPAARPNGLRPSPAWSVSP